MTVDLERLREELLDFYARRLPDPQEAEDFVQRAFERLLARQDVTNMRALLFEIARGLLKNEYRDRSREPEVVSWEALVGDGEQLDHLPQFQTYDFEDADFAAVHDRAVRALDPADRDAYIVTELRGLTSREAEPVLGVSRTTANARRVNATAEIRKELIR